MGEIKDKSILKTWRLEKKILKVHTKKKSKYHYFKYSERKNGGFQIDKFFSLLFFSFVQTIHRGIKEGRTDEKKEEERSKKKPPWEKPE